MVDFGQFFTHLDGTVGAGEWIACILDGDIDWNRDTEKRWNHLISYHK